MAAKYGLLVVLAVVMMCTLAWGQPPCEIWNWSAPNGHGVLKGLAVTSDGGFLLAGHTQWPGVAGMSRILVTKLSAQGDLMWSRVIRFQNYDFCEGIHTTPDGGFLMTACTAHDDGASWHPLVIKADSGGNVEWNRMYGGPDEELFVGSCATADGNIAIADKQLVDQNHMLCNMWCLRRITLTGDSLDLHCYHMQDAECESICPCRDGGYAIAGTQWYSDGGEWTDIRVRILRLDAEGDSLWSYVYSAPYRTLEAHSIVETADGGFAVVGNAQPVGYFLKTGPTGDSTFLQIYEGRPGNSPNGCRELWDVCQVPDGFLLTGTTTPRDSAAPGDSDLVLTKTDALGNILWEHQWGSLDTSEIGIRILSLPDSGYLLAGYRLLHRETGYALINYIAERLQISSAESPPSVFQQVSPQDSETVSGWRIHFAWTASYESNRCDPVRYCLEITNDSSATMVIRCEIADTSCFWSTWREMPFGRYHWRVAAYTMNGDTVWSATRAFHFVDLAATELSSSLPKTSALYLNYPNPFNPTTEISYDLPKTEHVELKVFDVLGRDVKTLVEGTVEAGNHRVVFEGSGLPSGVYVYRLQAGEFVQSRKMVLLK